MEATLKAITSRPSALRTRSFSVRTLTHPEKDPGCLLRGHDLLRPFVKQFQHALMILDREGCGRSSAQRDALESEIEDRLSDSGWADRAAAIVLEPELEAWVWSDSPHVESVLGWGSRQPHLRDWLRSKGLWGSGRSKPEQPKRAVEETLRLVKKPRSSVLYARLARLVSLDRCADPAFLKLRATLERWFPQGQASTLQPP